MCLLGLLLGSSSGTLFSSAARAELLPLRAPTTTEETTTTTTEPPPSTSTTLAPFPCELPTSVTEWAVCQSAQSAEQTGKFEILALWMLVLLVTALLVLTALRGRG